MCEGNLEIERRRCWYFIRRVAKEPLDTGFTVGKDGCYREATSLGVYACAIARILPAFPELTEGVMPKHLLRPVSEPVPEDFSQSLHDVFKIVRDMEDIRSEDYGCEDVTCRCNKSRWCLTETLKRECRQLDEQERHPFSEFLCLDCLKSGGKSRETGCMQDQASGREGAGEALR